MKSAEEKMLIKKNDNVMNKLFTFLHKIFSKKQNNVYETENINTKKENIKNEEKNTKFKDSVLNITNKETETIQVQKLYRENKIKESDLSEKQISDLCELYDKQIEKLKKSNEYRKQKLLQYRKAIKFDM